MSLPSAIRERIENCSNLPTLPSIALRVLDLCQHEQLDLHQIAGVIANDPALSAKLIRTANSPVFALRREVTTIPYAVSLLGINAVRTLVLSFSLTKTCRTGNRPGLRDYWCRSVLSALAARELCGGPSIVLREEAFLSALLQDIGMLVLSQTLGPQYHRLLASANRDHDQLIALEREAFGCDHALVGGWLLARWRVPLLLAEAVAQSHGPSPQPDAGPGSTLAGIVMLSGRFADQWAGDPQLASARLIEEAERSCGDGIPVNVEAVNATLIGQAPDLAELFDVKLDAAGMSATLDQAREVLLALSVRTSRELSGIHETLAKLESRTAILLAEAQQDPLTGVASRGYASSYLDEVFQAAVSAGRPIGTIFVDIDHFKNVNDTYGHAAGDNVLRSVAQILNDSVRGGDFVGRWGGEEFVILIRAENLTDLAMVAERVRRNVADARHAIGVGRSLSVTISLGCALLDAARHRRAADLLDEADRALYAAKRAGRNRIRMTTAA